MGKGIKESWDCPSCRNETAQAYIASSHHTERGYDYTRHIETKFFRCCKCDNYSQRVFTRTTYMRVPHAVAKATLGARYATD